MKSFLKIITLLFFLILILSSWWIFYYLLVYLPENRTKFLTSSDEAATIFHNDTNLQSIWGGGFSMKLTDGKRQYCYINKRYKGKCSEKDKEYFDISKNIPEDILFYRCEGNVVVRKSWKQLYNVSLKNWGNIIWSWIHFTYVYRDWMRYEVTLDSKEQQDCYPWDDLEDYWKRYGKATPEEIQAVIDKEKPTQ